MNSLTKIFIGLGSIFCLVLLGSGVFSQAYSDEFPTAEVGGVYQPMGWNTFQASWLIGHQVETTTGATLGQISSFVVDRTNGRIALVVLSDVPNLGAEPLAIPYSSITNIGAGTCEFNQGSMEIGPSLGPNYTTDDPYVYALTRFPSYSEFYGLPSTIDVAWLADIYRHYGQVPYWEAEGQQSPSSLELFDSDRLMGAQIQLSSGEAAGEIHDFVVDSSDGRIAFVVVSDFPERPTTLIAVPFAELSSRENGFVLNVTNDQLALAVGFDESELNNMRWAENEYRYFGLEPYWTERMEMAPASSEEGMEP
jgi:sporulation protein YlmC with PRC-barrel domain